jgi:hypothetical protein
MAAFSLTILSAGCSVPVGLGASGVTCFRASLPVPREPRAGVTVAYDHLLPVVGASVYPTSGDDLVVLHASADLGVFLSLAAHVRSGRDRSAGPEWWVILRPTVGVWRWDESAEDGGPFTGVRTGFFREFHRGNLRIEYGWTTLHDFAGDADARMQELSVSIGFLLGRD